MHSHREQYSHNPRGSESRGCPCLVFQVGSALVELLAEGVVKREDLWVTSKLWNSNHAASAVRPALEKTLADLGVSTHTCLLMSTSMAACNLLYCAVAELGLGC